MEKKKSNRLMQSIMRGISVVSPVYNICYSYIKKIVMRDVIKFTFHKNYRQTARTHL